MVQIKNDKHEIDHEWNWSAWKLLFNRFVHVYATIYKNKYIFKKKNLIPVDIIFEVNKIINKITHNTLNNTSNVPMVRFGEGLYVVHNKQ